MKIAIAGGSGFIGKHLIEYWSGEGHDLFLISRKRGGVEGANVATVTWEDLAKDPSLLSGVEAIVNLAGETINQRWTDAAKRRILESRIEATRRIGELVAALEEKPLVVVSGSAVGIYGMAQGQTFDETRAHTADDFLATVVRKWEQTAQEAIRDTRLVLLRTGVVLGRDGGAFPKMYLPYKMGVGGRIGRGDQGLSWIQIEDIVRLIDFCVRNEAVSGPVNAVSPQPVTNDQFGRTLGKVARRPHWMPVPSFAFRLLFGEMADLLLEGQKVLPQQALAHGFEFRYPTLEQALERTLNLV
ncbi:MAG TPA: TIGR01777 family oxidoreductase [Bacilli bacterium]|nr:TIGR01777 family oxidoreductase [Bacilli bacterium]